MRKLILIFTLLFSFSAAIFAQSGQTSKYKFSIGLDAGLPLGNNYYYDLGKSSPIGADVKLDVPLSPRTALTFAIDYVSVKNLYEHEFSTSSSHFLPLKMGVKHYINNIYAELDAGYVAPLTNGQKGGPLFTPGLGYYLTKNLDVSLRYEAWIHHEKDRLYYASSGSGSSGTNPPAFAKSYYSLSQLALRVAYTL